MKNCHKVNQKKISQHPTHSTKENLQSKLQGDGTTDNNTQHMDIATYILNRPRGKITETICCI